MGKVPTVKSILFYYIIDTKLLRTGIARTALHLRLHARLCPLLLLHRSACSLPDRSRTPARGGYSSLLVFTSPTVFPLLPRIIPNLPRNLPRKLPQDYHWIYINAVVRVGGRLISTPPPRSALAAKDRDAKCIRARHVVRHYL